jgi:N-acetylglucosaminyl-diphospho-decaprenol L-rhamnosyltransferase
VVGLSFGGGPAAASEAHKTADDDLVIVSIVGFRNAEDVANCLRALTHSTHANYVVSVCENGGAMAFDALVEEVGAIALSSEDRLHPVDERIGRTWCGRLSVGNQPIWLFEATANLGYAGGVNVTLRQIHTDPSWSAVWLLNPDTEPDAHALSALVLRAHATGAAIVGGRLVFHDTGRIQLCGGRWRPILARGLNIGLNEPGDALMDTTEIERTMTYVSGAALYATREFINEVGLMDERYFLYCEDIEWCLRISPSRLRYADDSTVRHKHGTAIGSHRNHSERSATSIYFSERNKLLMSRRLYRNKYPLIVTVSLGLILQYLVRGAWSNAVTALRGWLAGVRGETGLPLFLRENANGKSRPTRYTI